MRVIVGRVALNTENVGDDMLIDKINSIIDPNVNGAVISLYATLSGASGTASGCEIEFWVGQRNPVEKSVVPYTNNPPRTPEDVMADQMPAYPNERIRFLLISKPNTPVAGDFLNYRVVINEV